MSPTTRVSKNGIWLHCVRPGLRRYVRLATPTDPLRPEWCLREPPEQGVFDITSAYAAAIFRFQEQLWVRLGDEAFPESDIEFSQHTLVNDAWEFSLHSRSRGLVKVRYQVELTGLDQHDLNLSPADYDVLFLAQGFLSNPETRKTVFRVP